MFKYELKSPDASVPPLGRPIDPFVLLILGIRYEFKSSLKKPLLPTIIETCHWPTFGEYSSTGPFGCAIRGATIKVISNIVQSFLIIAKLLNS
jgi:hypothetical protein